jgi:hypothetical protein
MKERGLKPTMSEAQLLEAWGIKTEEEHVPLLVRPKKDARLIHPTFKEHKKR